MGCGPSRLAAAAVSPPPSEATTTGTAMPSASSSSDVVSHVRRAFSSDNDFTRCIVRMQTSDVTPIESVYDILYDEEPLGQGAGGKVYRARHIATSEYFAVKCLEKRRIGTQEGLDQLRDEVSIMCELDHPNIVRIEEVYESPDMLYIVQELCTGGELFDRLEDEWRFSEAQSAKFVKQMAAAVCYLHKHGIVHRDLKLENFLYESSHENSELVMIDFGLSKHFVAGQHHHDSVGTPYTAAPEIIHGDYDEKVDLWALGVITYLLLSGETPFGGLDGEDNEEIRRRILEARLDFEPVDVWADVSDLAKSFVRALLNPDPLQRPTAKQVKNDPWIRAWTNPNHRNARESESKLNPSTVKAMLKFKELSELEKLQSGVLSFTLFPEQIVELRREFDKIDTKGNGEVSLMAFRKAVADTYESETLETAFDSIKLRRDARKLRWHEFLAAVISLARIDDRNMRLAFDRLDREGKGYLTLEDLSRFGVLVSEALFGDCCSEPGRISYTDFKRIPSGWFNLAN